MRMENGMKRFQSEKCKIPALSMLFLKDSVPQKTVMLLATHQPVLLGRIQPVHALLRRVEDLPTLRVFVPAFSPRCRSASFTVFQHGAGMITDYFVHARRHRVLFTFAGRSFGHRCQRTVSFLHRTVTFH